MAFGYHCPSRNLHAEYEVLGAERIKDCAQVSAAVRALEDDVVLTESVRKERRRLQKMRLDPANLLGDDARVMCEMLTTSI
jgi:hypothetical protein